MKFYEVNFCNNNLLHNLTNNESTVRLLKLQGYNYYFVHTIFQIFFFNLFLYSTHLCHFESNTLSITFYCWNCCYLKLFIRIFKSITLSNQSHPIKPKPDRKMNKVCRPLRNVNRFLPIRDTNPSRWFFFSPIQNKPIEGVRGAGGWREKN